MHPVTPSAGLLSRAYAECEALARSHYENFPVASWLLPRPMRPHVAALYAFARVADDIADEGTAPARDRLAQLDAWQRRLHAAVAIEASEGAPHEHDDLILVALAHSIRTLDLPIALFDDLVSAFGQDTMTSRYASWADVFDYCRRSANPVGRLVLRIGGYRDTSLDVSSDALCTALQLANFWQDVSVDYAKGRIYLPLESLRKFGVKEDDLANNRNTAAFCEMMRFEVERARDWFRQGQPLIGKVNKELAIDLDLFSRGGLEILNAIEKQGFAVLGRRPSISKPRKLALVARAALGKLL
jgi:squalene synthase HpnC